MIVQLLPSDIKKHWKTLSNALVSMQPAMSIGGKNYVNSILVSLLSGRAQVWVLLEGTDINAFAITYIYVDFLSGAKHLVIYLIYAFNKLGWKIFREGEEVYINFAKKNNCSHIILYVGDEKYKKMAERFGYGLKWSAFVKEVK